MGISRYLVLISVLVGCNHIAAKDNDPVIGKFISAKGASLEFVHQNSEDSIVLKVGHQSFVANIDHRPDGYCFMFSNLDIILPANVQPNSVFECLGGTATVVNSSEPFLLANGMEITVAKIKIHRFAEVAVEGKLYRRPGGEIDYFLYLSPDIGLVGINLSIGSEQGMYRRMSK